MAISGAGLTGWFHSGFLEFQRERLIPYFLVFVLGSMCQERDVFASEKNVKHYVLANAVLPLSLGVLAMIMANFAIPAFMKYLLLVVLAYAGSNILVYIYDSFLQKTEAAGV